MEGFDEGSVYYSYQNREANDDGTTNDGTQQGRTSPTLSPGEVRRRFKAFILGFTNERYRYVYRDQLRTAVNASTPLLNVHLGDLTHFDPPLATTIRESPDISISQAEKAATEASAIIRSLPITATENNETNPETNNNVMEDGENITPNNSTDVSRMGGIQVTFLSNEAGKYIRSLSSSQVSKLIVISGIVIASSKIRCKSTNVVLKCRNCNDKITIPVTSGLGGFSVPRSCKRQQAQDEIPCPLDPYVILADESKYIDNQILKLQELPESVPTGEMPRSITLSCDRYLTDKVTPGVRINIIGVYSISNAAAPGTTTNSKKKTNFHVSTRQAYVKVVGIKVQENIGYSDNSNMVHFDFEEEEKMMKISKTKDLVQIISRSIAPEIFGHEDIKKSIAAQLFAGAQDKILPDGMKLRGDINILLLGDPSTAKSQLLKFTERLAPISVYTSGKGSSAAGLTASVIKDKMNGEFHLEGGAMVLADGGIVCIDEFDKMRLQDRVAIHEAMEQQTISIAKAGITAVLNARSAVLAAANPAFGRYDDTRTSAENIEFQSTILSRFDLIFIVRDVRNDERDRLIANHVLSLHQRGSESISTSATTGANGNAPTPNSESTTKDHDVTNFGITGEGDDRKMDIDSLKRYISYSRAKASPRLSEEASRLLESNYVSIREQMRAKQLGDDEEDGSSKTVPITIRQLEAIVRISEALAKMTLQPIVNEQHVTEAIRLFKVATLDSANAGAIQSAEGALTPQVRREVQQIEAGIKRRLAIGSMASERRLIDHFVDERFSEYACRSAIMVMVRRGDLQYRRQRKYVYRVQ